MSVRHLFFILITPYLMCIKLDIKVKVRILGHIDVINH